MSDNGWINCSSAHKWGVLYMETKVSDQERTIFVNVRSLTGNRNVGEISLFKDTLSFEAGENWGSILKYGWRIPLKDYLDIMQDQDEGRHIISWADLTKASGRGKTRIQQLINCGSLDGIIKDGPAILSHKSLETLVMEIDAVVKPANVNKAKAGAKGRWKLSGNR